MLSNPRFRILYLILTPFLLVAFSYDYAQNVGRRQLELRELEQRALIGGITAYIPFGTVRAVRDGSLAVLHRGMTYNLQGYVHRARPGDVISLEVYVGERGGVTIVRGHLHRYRTLKWLSGVIALVGFVAWIALPWLASRRAGHG